MAKTYRPRRANKRWLEGAPEYVLDCFDNKGKTVDRYDVLIYWSELGEHVATLGMSGAPTHPQGFSQWGEYHGRQIAAYRYREGHHRVKWSDLPEHIRRHVIARAESCE